MLEMYSNLLWVNVLVISLVKYRPRLVLRVIYLSVGLPGILEKTNGVYRRTNRPVTSLSVKGNQSFLRFLRQPVGLI